MSDNEVTGRALDTLSRLYEEKERTFPKHLLENVLEVESTFQFSEEREVPLVRLRRIVETYVGTEMSNDTDEETPS